MTRMAPMKRRILASPVPSASDRCTDDIWRVCHTPCHGIFPAAFERQKWQHRMTPQLHERMSPTLDDEINAAWAEVNKARRERDDAWAAIKRVRAVEREPWGPHLADGDDFWSGWREGVDAALEALDA